MTLAAGEGGSGWGAHLQRGVHDLVHGGEVSIPQELGLLLESQHALGVDAAHGGGDLCGVEQRGPHSAAPQQGSLPLPPSPCGTAPPLPGAGSGPGFPRVCVWEDAPHLPPEVHGAPGLQLEWDPHSRLDLPTGGLPGSAVRGSPPDLAGGSTGIRIGGFVPGMGQDLDAVPAAGASRCP